MTGDFGEAGCIFGTAYSLPVLSFLLWSVWTRFGSLFVPLLDMYILPVGIPVAE